MEADQSLIMDELVEKYTRHVQPDVTLAVFVRKNPWFLIALTAVVLGIGTVIAVILGSNRRMRKVAQERAAFAASLKEKTLCWKNPYSRPRVRISQKPHSSTICLTISERL